MLWYLTILSVLSTFLAGAIFVFLLQKEKHLESLKFFILGVILMLVDFLVEYTGTTNGLWIYHQSVFFVLGHVPIELMFLFFSTGVLAGFFFTRMSKMRIPIRVNTVFYFLILVTFLFYVREIYLTGRGRILYLAIVVGLWGFYNISERNKESALALALVAVFVDLVVEKLVIGVGGYSYQYGFDMAIPFTYGLLTLGLLAVMEKLYKLDRFLEHPLVKNLLKLFGVKREEYKERFNSVKNRVQEKISKD